MAQAAGQAVPLSLCFFQEKLLVFVLCYVSSFVCLVLMNECDCLASLSLHVGKMAAETWAVPAHN